MAKGIGPTFPVELQAAGLLALPFSWGSDGQIVFDESVTKAQRDAVLAVYAAHDPLAKLASPVDTATPLKAALAAAIAAPLIPQPVKDLCTALRAHLGL